MRGPVFCTTNTLKNRKSVLNIHTHYLAIVDLASRSHHHGKQHQRRHAATTRAEVATSRRKNPRQSSVQQRVPPMVAQQEMYEGWNQSMYYNPEMV